MSTTLATATNYETEVQIGSVKDWFLRALKNNLNVIKVEGPLVVEKGTGINDDLNGIESPVAFTTTAIAGKTLEIVQSLAKWKRLRLSEIEAPLHSGLVVDMRALRPDEELSTIHSLYVDQWDWEKVISAENRTIDYLKQQVRAIYASIKSTEIDVAEAFDIEPVLPSNIHFIHAEELLLRYPDLSPKERENAVTQNYGAVFIIGIGHDLSNGEPHDLRSPDYDDWSTVQENGLRGLNGDLLVWNPVLKSAFEISSMGIRVDEQALRYQLGVRGQEKRLNYQWHQQLVEGVLPLTIGGGIGQSRLTMFLLRKSHISQVQQSVWN
jgi:aspartate--ammonia ligase